LATNWTISFLPGAKRELRFLRAEVREAVFRRILEAIGDLVEDPAPPDAVPLRRTKDYYRIRVEGNYRVIYRVSSVKHKVLVVAIRPRSLIYREWLKWGPGGPQ
jgi:mRNA-degrading endonuclease RelE of RelBE toxin-antitoxin system